jgi:MoxR-like ATPase
VPDLDDALAKSVVRLINAMRAMPLRKSPSISESIDWARTLLALGATTLSDEIVNDTLGVVLKHADDATKARAQLELE